MVCRAIAFKIFELLAFNFNKAFLFGVEDIIVRNQFVHLMVDSLGAWCCQIENIVIQFNFGIRGRNRLVVIIKS